MKIQTTHGEMDESALTKKEGAVETDHEFTKWVEYWLDDELVHRSVHVHLKKAPALFPELETING
jgi:hypothetical protein